MTNTYIIITLQIIVRTPNHLRSYSKLRNIEFDFLNL